MAEFIGSTGNSFKAINTNIATVNAIVARSDLNEDENARATVSIDF